MSTKSKDAIRVAIAHYESKMKENPQYGHSEVFTIVKGLYQALKEIDKYDEIVKFIIVK